VLYSSTPFYPEAERKHGDQIVFKNIEISYKFLPLDLHDAEYPVTTYCSLVNPWSTTARQQ
jgi:hypothetical protein